MIGETEKGHNQEFFDTTSTFIYFILEGSGYFFINDEEVAVSKGDCVSIPSNTRIYFKGKMKWLLVTTPAWKPENEVRSKMKV